MPIYYDKPSEEYFTSPGISKSGLDQIAKSPLHYQNWLNTRVAPTAAMAFGSAVHTMVLEYDSFDDRYILMPEGLNRRTNAGKEAAAEIEASGKTILTQSDYDKCRYIFDSIHRHPTASDIFSEGRSEVSVMANVQGIVVKGRTDWFRQGILADLKTTQDASPEEFARSVAKYRYHVQDAVYTDLFDRNSELIHNFFFIAVETSAPYAVKVYELDEQAKEVGRKLYDRDLQTYIRCSERNEWPGYEEGVTALALPRWATFRSD